MCNVNRNIFLFLEEKKKKKKVMPPIEVDTWKVGAGGVWKGYLSESSNQLEATPSKSPVALHLLICSFGLERVLCIRRFQNTYVYIRKGVVPMHVRCIISHRTHAFYVYTWHVRIRKSTSDRLTWIGRCYHSQRINDSNGNPSASQ